MTIERITDTELMARLRADDMSALGELANRHQSKVLALAYRTTGKWDQAEDIAQEVFLRVYKAAKHYKPTAKFSTWLYRITMNLSIDLQRQAARKSISLDPSLLNSKTVEYKDSMEKKEIATLVQEAVIQLPERQRYAVILHRYEGLKHSEISDIMDVSISAVESLLVRAYANLREKLKKFNDFP